MNGAALTGRSAELDAVRALVGPGPDAPRSLVVLGEAGIGKSAILGELRAYAQARGWRVLAAAGREHETGLAFAGLHQLLSPVLTGLLAMPGRHAEELRAAIGMDSLAGLPDPALAGAALAELLARPPGPDDGVLLLVDDAHWMDAATMETLSLAARRPGPGPVAMVFAALGEVPPPELDGHIKQLPLGPLSSAEAGALLDAQPVPPRGRVRGQVLAQAAGNPLALTELSRAVANELNGRRDPAGLPLPLTDRLDAVFATRLRGLPDRTRKALLLIAAADAADLAALMPSATGLGPPDLDPAVLAPAEERGLIKVTADGARFRHPLARSAVYSAENFADRLKAHQALAAILRDEPDRRAWHLGAAASRPDETVASLLAATAADASRRSGAPAAALALERAADLTPDAGTRATRLIAAAEFASRGGQFEWAHDLAARALALPGAAHSAPRARLLAGQTLAWTGRPGKAVETLLPLARESAGDDPRTAWNALATAATACYQTGDARDRQRVADAMALLPAPADDETRAQRWWLLAVTGQADPADIVSMRSVAPAADARSLAHMGAAAWLLDQTGRAIKLLESAREAADVDENHAAAGDPLAALGWAYVDAGRWPEALEVAAASDQAASADPAGATGRLISATIEAARGQTGQARVYVAAALAAGTEHSGLLTARARHALGICALSDEDYETAFGQLRSLFADDGAPCHYHVSYLAVGDLAVAAARCGRRLEGRELLKEIKTFRERTGVPESDRMRQLLDRADSALADPETPGAYQPAALGRAADGQWAFESALFRLEAGEWLRRRRRINEAKPVLRAALDAFRALRVTAWEHRAEAELRACGVTVPGTLTDSRRLRELTPQQQRILGLAAQGLSNREIAQRLFLSPKTVASHLYNSFPVLGVAGRHQLRLLFAQPELQT
jgi:DNA-binding CsgD family transcriptional regulator